MAGADKGSCGQYINGHACWPEKDLPPTPLLAARAVAAEAFLNGIAVAMFLLDGQLAVAYLNSAAERLLAAGDGLMLIEGRLVAAIAAEGVALLRLVASALECSADIPAPAPVMIRVSRPTNRAPYEVLVTPLLQRATQPILLGAWAAVFVCDPAAEQTASLAALQRAYGLSAAEARLMQGLLAGETLGSIAEKRSVSKETIRSQIRSVFTKTGTSNQNQLLRLGLRSLAALL